MEALNIDLKTRSLCALAHKLTSVYCDSIRLVGRDEEVARLVMTPHPMMPYNARNL